VWDGFGPDDSVGNPGALPRLRGRGQQGNILRHVVAWSGSVTFDYAIIPLFNVNPGLDQPCGSISLPTLQSADNVETIPIPAHHGLASEAALHGFALSLVCAARTSF